MKVSHMTGVVIVVCLLDCATSRHGKLPDSSGKEDASLYSTGKCSSDKDCTPVYECVEGECICSNATSVPIYVPEKNSTDCLTAFNETGGSCTSNLQCRYDHGKCSDQGECSCSARFAQDDRRCVPYVKSSTIPIAIGVAIGVSVLGTILLYLWLSRRKQER